MSGATNHKGGRKSDKLWRDALIVAAKRTDEDGRVYLAKIAEKCVEAAASGDISAMKEIGDRIDGKAPQSVDVTTRHEQSITEWSDTDLERLIAERSTGSARVAPKTQGPQKPH